MLFAFGLLREGEGDHVETLLLACGGGVVVAEARWILQFMPLDSYPAGLVLLLSFVKTSWALLLVFALVYGLIAVSILDSVLMWRRTRKKLEAQHGPPQKGEAFYAIMRAFQMRRTRMPQPQVARGEAPA